MLRRPPPRAHAATRPPPGAGRALLLASLAAALPAAAGCRDARSGPGRTDRPNVLWILWDTVRADHLSLYGYERPTTPRLDEWARGARVFENCIAPAPSTTPSHGTMFTGLMPCEHGADDVFRFLDDRHATVAELLRAQGYQTFLYSANPNISRAANFHRGFDAVEHPWSPRYSADALRLIQGKLSPRDQSSDLPDEIRSGRVDAWSIKATGALAQQATLAWLAQRDPRRPFFIFLNYMEAHRPYIPPESCRQRFMTAAELDRSYQVDRSWSAIWTYTFGLREYTDDELRLTRLTYDACLAELDDLLHDLLAALAAGGALDNTVIILTADHGELLGEHHMLDHQYALYQPLLHVPLIVHYPRAFAPGRDTRPVSCLDLFATVLELAGTGPPAGVPPHAVSLLRAPAERIRLAEYPAAFLTALEVARKARPGWDSLPWQRTLRALYRGDHKFIWGSDGRHELYDLGSDPHELTNLAGRAELAGSLAAELARVVAGLRPVDPATRTPPELTDAERRRLGAVGYFDLASEVEPPVEPADQKE